MLWLVVVAASTWFGYQIIQFARLTNLGFLPRVFSGWLLGSILCGMVLYITTFIIPLSFIHTLLLAIVLIGASAALLKRGPRGKSNSELTPWLLFYLLLTAGISLRYCASLYNRLPLHGPGSFAAIYDTEISFITSVISGCNRRHLLYYNNPLIAGEKFHGSALPLLFTAVCMTFGASYSDASIIISFMNTVSTAFAVYAVARKFTKWPVVSSLLFLFSGSWAGYVYFRAVNRMAPENDLVHQFQPTHQTVWFQTFASLLSMAKCSSYSIALSQFAIYWSPSLLSGVMTALIPSVAASFGMFGLFAGIPNSLTQILPFAVSAVPRLYPFIYRYRPLYREAEMRGTFFAPLVIWFLALGPVFVVVLLFLWKLPKDKLRQYVFAAIGPFLLLHFLREGVDHFQNAVAISCIALPFVMIFFTELLRKFTTWPEDMEYQGSATFVVAATVAFLLFGGYICASRIARHSIPYLSRDDLELVKAVLNDVPAAAVVLGRSKVLHPLVMTGRQQFLADRMLVWNYGFNIATKLDQIDRLLHETTAQIWHDLGVAYVIEERGEDFQVQAPVQLIRQTRNYRLARVAD
jgi:hypothetical protein